MNRWKLSAAIAATSLVLVGAPAAFARDPKPPQVVSDKGLGKMWSDGAKRVSRAQGKLNDANRVERDATSKKSRNTARVDEAKVRIQSAEEAYKRLLASLKPASDYRGVWSQADSLKESADRWREAVKMREGAEKEIREADDSLAWAARTKKEAEIDIASGRMMQAQAGDPAHAALLAPPPLETVPTPVPAPVAPPTP
jgi:hypothetical protein